MFRIRPDRVRAQVQIRKNVVDFNRTHPVIRVSVFCPVGSGIFSKIYKCELTA